MAKVISDSGFGTEASRHEEDAMKAQKGKMAPTLFVGLGGVGSKLVARLAELAADDMDNPDKRMRFVAIDTDANELQRIKVRNKRIITIHTAVKKTVGQYLEYDENAKKNWFPINEILLGKTPVEGAGQIRAISNLVAHTATRRGELSELDQALDSLFLLNSDSIQQTVRITILGSVAGGTGSGLILPMALYIRNYLARSRQQQSCIVRGFFFLPDTLDSVMSNETEKDNLRSNAYATIREIDAFMRYKNDNEMCKRYPHLKVLMPRVGSDGGYDEFNQPPFDACFLFNRISTENLLIETHQDLLEHAAQTVYIMTISPIREINSQEDNLIREKIINANGSSYAGVGSSLILYPFEDVVRFIALNWTKETISKQWLDIDDKVMKIKLANEEARNKGRYVPPEDEMEIFISQVFTAAAAEDSFYKVIENQCYRPKDTSGKREDLSEAYVTAVENFCENQRVASNAGRSGDFDKIMKAYNTVCEAKKTKTVQKSNVAEELGVAEEECIMAAKTFLAFYDGVIESARTLIGHLEDAVLDEQSENTSETAVVPLLKSYMTIGKEKFMHPIAARFFLMKVSKLLDNKVNFNRENMEKAKALLEAYCEDLQRIVREGVEPNEEKRAAGIIADVKKAAKDLWDGLTDDKEIEVPATNFTLKIFKKLNALCSKCPENLRESDEVRSGILDDYCYFLINYELLQKLNNYVKNLIAGYQEFFNSIKGDLESIDAKISAYYKKFENTEGHPIIYACADETCLDGLLEICRCQIGASDLPEDLTKNKIYFKARKYALLKTKGDFNIEYGLSESSSSGERLQAMRSFFGDSFENGIMDFCCSIVHKNYDSYLDMDVIEALMMESRFLKHYHQDTASQIAYMTDKIKEGVNLSVAFIDQPFGEPRDICRVGVNDAVKKSWNRSKLDAIQSALNADRRKVGIIDSDEFSKYALCFYQSIFNISARDLVKFACSDDTSVGNSSTRFANCGQYFRVYHERISRIDPLDAKNREITPHIEKTWQYLNVLPELDQDFQLREEVRIAKAFVYALVAGKIAYRKHDRNGFNYCYEIIDAKVKAPELYVSNGTRCDQFYELLDAFTLCPRYVDRILEVLEEDITEEKNRGNDFLQTQFAKKKAVNILIDEFAVSETFNIFHIEAIIKAIFEIINDYVSCLEDKNDVSDIACELEYRLFLSFYRQLDTLVALRDGDKKAKLPRKHIRLEKIKSDGITLRVCELIADELRKSDAMNPHAGQYEAQIDYIERVKRALNNEDISDLLIDESSDSQAE